MPPSSLQKINLVRNKNYQASGIKSYVFMLRKYGFQPTLEGPFQAGSHLEQSGKFHPRSQHPIGGKARVTHSLVKTKADGTTGEV